VQSLGCEVLGAGRGGRVLGAGFWLPGFGCRVWGAGFAGFGVAGLGWRVLGAGTPNLKP
jgi:hypothetical protein